MHVVCDTQEIAFHGDRMVQKNGKLWYRRWGLFAQPCQASTSGAFILSCAGRNCLEAFLGPPPTMATWVCPGLWVHLSLAAGAAGAVGGSPAALVGLRGFRGAPGGGGAAGLGGAARGPGGSAAAAPGHPQLRVPGLQCAWEGGVGGVGR